MSDLGAALQRLSLSAPDQPAVQFKNTRLNYRELLECVERFQGVAGVPSAKRVLVILPDGILTYLVHLWAFLGGATIVPQSILAPPPHVQFIRERVQPDLVITTEALYAKHKTAIGDLPVLLVRAQQLDRHLDVAAMLSWKPGSEAGASSVTREPEDIRLIIFTSGSTGVPKGVCLSELNVLAAAGMMVDFLSLDPSRMSVATVPLYDYYGMIQIYGHILSGASWILGENTTLPNELFRRINGNPVTDLVLVPYTLRQIIGMNTDARNEAIGKLGVITSSSDVLTPEILAGAFALNPRVKIVNIYGLTEAGRACYKDMRSTSPLSKSIGRPSKGVEIRIDSPVHGSGEIVIVGPNVMKGYLTEVRGNRIGFSPCSEVRTGDVGHFDDSGDIILEGRRDHLINLMGLKIHPSEIESLALSLAEVREAFAYPRVGPSGDTQIHLDVVLATEAFDLATLTQRMRDSLPHVFVPKQINCVAAIRKTELGSKIVRRAE